MVQPTRRENLLFAAGSPVFIFSNSAIGASGKTVIDCETGTPTGYAAKTAAKYLPLDTVKVSNTSNSLLRIKAGQMFFTVPANSTVVRENLAYSSLEITELSAAAVAASSVYFDCYRQPISQDKALQQKYGGVPQYGTG